MRLLLLFFVLFSKASSLNIVFYLSLVGKSHIDFVASLIDVLVDRGHNVDYIVARLNSGVKWEGTSRARNVTSFGFPNNDSPWMHMDHLKNPFHKYTNFNFAKFYGIQNQLCEIGIESGIPLEFMKAGKYDAAIVSDYDYCGGILAKAAGIPTVMSYTATNIMLSQTLHVGLPNPVSCVAANFDKYEGSFSFMSKLNRLIHTGLYELYYRPYALNRQTELARKYYGLDFPDIREVTQNYDLVFINSNEIIEAPRTISHKVRYIGGVALRPNKTVPADYEKILQIPSKGVVIFSFGTQVPSDKVTTRVKAAIAEAFSEFSEYTFIWKHELQPGDEAAFFNVRNLHMVPWLPQNDLLHHERVVAFITHAGLNSFLEASHAGVPVVSIPLFADQGHNARSMSRLEMGVQLDKLTFTGEDLTAALRKVLEDEKYSENAKKISKMMNSKPEQAKVGFAEWVEFAATNPGLHKVFNLPEAKMSVFTYYCLDLIAFIVTAVILSFYLFKKCTAFLLSFLLRNPAKEKVN